MGRPGRLTAALLALTAGSATAADLDGPVPYEPAPVGLPRYFPRADGAEAGPPRILRPLPRPVGCTPRRAPVPTDAPDDPSYVGSPYGLGKPSYYGFTPPLGVDDPYGRSLLPYCR